MKKILLTLLIIFLILPAKSFATEFDRHILVNELKLEIQEKESITLKELASIIVKKINLSYENYEYYRSLIKDTANRDMLILYSEGILQGDGNGYLKEYRILTDAEIESILNRVVNPLPVIRPTYANINNIPILMYHEINPLPNNGPTNLYVSQENFAKQLDALRNNGYNTVSMEQVYQHWINKIPLPNKPIVLTFDDGYKSHFNYAMVELNKRAMTGTFYLTIFNIGEGKRISEDMVKEMYNIGMEIGSHTINHVNALVTPLEELKIEYKESKVFLENLLNIDIKHFCYPNGDRTSETEKLLIDLGYKTSPVVITGKANYNQGLFNLRRITIDYNDTIDSFLNKIK